MADAYVIIDAHEVHDLAVDINRRTGQLPRRAQYAVSKVGHDMQAAAMVLVPVDTGFLRQSITLDVGGLSFDLGPTAEYGGFVELGVDHPFEITAHGGWLAFDEGGAEVFARKVEHPAMPPQPYLAPAFEQQLPNLERALGQIGEDVFRAAA